MEKKKAISLGFALLLIFVLIGVFIQISIYDYIEKQKEGDKQQVDLIISGKLPESLRCVKEIKIKNQELLISLDDTASFSYSERISGNPVVFKSNGESQLLYSSCRYSNNESYYRESLNLVWFDGRSAKFLTTVTYSGDTKPVVHKREFIVNEQSLSVTE
ncbi:MAG: hypothetical protein ABH865_08525 [Candidatus Omnitrophota bacterium]